MTASINTSREDGVKQGSTSLAPLVRRRSRPGPSFGVAPQALVILASAYFVLPVIWLLIASTKSVGSLFSTAAFALPERIEFWSNVRSTFTQDGGIFLRWLGNTLAYAGGGALIATALSAMAGYAIAKYDFPGRKLLFALAVGSIMIPVTALAIPTYLLVSPAGLTDTMWAVLLPSCVSPLGLYISRLAATHAVPDEVLQAARVDGAGELRIFFTIATRMMGPALVTVFLFQFVSIWNNYLLPLVMLSSNHLFPLSLGLTSWNETLVTTGTPPLTSVVITGSLLSVVPLVVAFLVLQRYWRSGLAAGAVVG